jgi:hypothetical protein
LPVQVAASPEAALALELAERLEAASNATAAANVAGRLADALARVRAMAPEQAKESPLDEIRARRDANKARKSGAKA